MFKKKMRNIHEWVEKDRMTGKREEKRRDLRARLIEATRQRIVKFGLENLRARDIAQDAGCALGSLYTAFTDLFELVVHVNSQTLEALEVSLRLTEAKEKSPAERLRNLGQGYLRFAMENQNLWKALFDHVPSETNPSPQWHLEEHSFLMKVIAEPLAQLLPEMSEEDRDIRARTLFGAVNGVVSLSLEARFVGLPQARLAQEVDDLISMIAAGATRRREEMD